MSNLRSDVEAVLSNIPIDFGGGCSLSKAYLMAWLIRWENLKTTLDIGVYRGRSLFPQALTHYKFTKGIVYGVDPWSNYEAQERDNLELKDAIEEFWQRTNLQDIYEQVEALNDELQYQDHCVFLRKPSANAIDYFKEKKIFFDMIHIDGNHDTDKVLSDINLYVPCLKKNGYVVMDDVSWDSVKPAYRILSTKMNRIFERIDGANDYAVFWNGTSSIGATIRRMSLAYIGQK